MFTVLVTITMVFIAWKWGDWKHWKKYQSTILYYITLDLLYNFLCYHYSMWEYEPWGIFSNHTVMNIFVIVVGHSCTTLIYLGNFPTKRKNQFLWVSLWVVGIFLMEWMNVKIFEGITYHNGWNFIWSFIFYILMFSFLRLHYLKPLLTYGLSFIVTIGLLLLFKVPIENMK